MTFSNKIFMNNPMKQIIADMNEKIRKHHFTVINVFAGEDTPTFSYTVGLFASTGQPELFMTGFDPQLMHSLLTDAAKRVLNDGDVYADGGQSDKIIQNFPVAFKAPTAGVEVINIFNMATQYYEGEPFIMLQMFLPDPNGKFPWDDDCNQQYIRAQSELIKEATPSGRLKPH